MSPWLALASTFMLPSAVQWTVEPHICVSDTPMVTANVALNAGSSKHGNALRAAVASNCVTAMLCSHWVLSFSTMKDVDWIGGMNFFELVTTVPTDLFLPVGGLLIAIFAAWVMSRDTALRALDAGPNGFRVWQLLVRYVSIPLVVVVLASGLI